MTISFRYEKLRRPDGTLRRAPFIPILVQNVTGRMMRMIALVDSGADTSVIPKEAAQIMGLKPQEEAETRGIGGAVKVRRAQFNFRITNMRENYPLKVDALVLDEDSDVPLILGRNSFFENFHITFRQNEQRIILKKVQLPLA